MNNIFKNKRKIYIITLLLLFFVFNLFTELRFYGNRLDFYWNFNFGLQISNGLIPYNDFNMVTTPLLAYITAIILKIFGKEIFVYAITMAILKVLQCFLVAHIAKKIQDNDNKIFTITFILSNLIMYHYYFEYNYLAILFLILIILKEIKQNKSLKDEIVIGILSSLAILSKHSVGAIILLFVLMKPIIFKENKKNILYRILGSIIPITIFIINLLLTNSLNSFISYTILGLKEFKANTSTILDNISQIIKNRFGFLFYIILLVASVLYILISIYNIIKKKKKYKNEEKQILFYSISSFACFYPIMDDTHLIPSILPILILECIAITKLINNLKNRNNIAYKMLKGYFIIVIMITIFYPLYNYVEVKLDKNNKYIVIGKELNHLKGIVIKKNKYNSINNLIEYEKEENKKEITIKYLDSEAVLLHLPQDKYYKDYDLFMKGNFGENGEERIIKEVDNSTNTKYLISKNYFIKEKDSYNQIPTNVIDYVINNYKVEGEKDIYIIYSK